MDGTQDSLSVLSRIKQILEKVHDPLHDNWDPAELGLLISKLEYTDLDIKLELEKFSKLINRVKEGMALEAAFHDKVNHVIKIYSKELNFKGDTTNYYNIKNSFLSDVLVRRKGIPISLSLVFMALCRGVGLKAVGINFPGHFLVRVIPTQGHFDLAYGSEKVENWKQQTFVDCFDGGTILTTEDCEKRFREWTRGILPFGPDLLSVSHPRSILSRMLRNLKAIFAEKEDLPRLYWVLSALIELSDSDRLESYRERGLLFLRMGRYAHASTDFRKYLSETQDAEKKAHVEKLLNYFEGLVEVSN